MHAEKKERKIACFQLIIKGKLVGKMQFVIFNPIVIHVCLLDQYLSGFWFICCCRLYNC